MSDRAPVAPAGGAFASASASIYTLRDGTRLRDYEITGLIGEGGFGIVYLAFDHSLQRRVAIKEYMPSSMASRAARSAEVKLKSDRHLETFKAGLKSFVNEARLLARFDHPSLVKVYRFWEDNGTAYMVVPYYEGPTLKHALAERSQPPDEAELCALLRPLLSALRRCTPNTASTAGEVSSMSQGVWTDLYALASVVYAAVTGQPPISSVERLMDDRMPPFSQAVAGRYSESFVTAIYAALALRPKDRPHSVGAFQRLLDDASAQSAPAAGPASTHAAVVDAAETATNSKPPPRAMPGALLPFSMPAPVSKASASTSVAPAPWPNAPGPSPDTTHSVRRTGRVLAVAGMAFAAIGAAAYFSSSRTTPVLTPVPIFKAPAGGAAASAADTAPAADTSASPAPVPEAPKQEAPTLPAAASSRSVRASPAHAPAATPLPLPLTVPVPAPAVAPAIPTTSVPLPDPGDASRCSDILQKASLEPLSAAERELLKRECR